MGKRLEGRLVIATHNTGKLWEMRALLAPHGIEAVSAAEISLSEPAETGKNFQENAALKARAAAQAANLAALAD
ncbi:MAG: non-canonical purine NTP pyrophosphatase, partial [Methylovirgula sp.]